MIDMTTNKSCVPQPRSHFQGNGSCDAMREANKRADHQTGMTAGMMNTGMMNAGMTNTGMMNAGMTNTGMMNTGVMNTGMTNSGMANNGMMNGFEGEIAPITAAESQMMQNQAEQNQTTQSQVMQSESGFGQMVPVNGAESDMIYDGYGTEHDHTENEEDGMTSIPQDSFNTPLNADEAARNSWRALLARNVGRNVLVQFLMGTQNMVTVEGELYEVGTDYIVIYQPLWDSHITADLYSVKFVEFREPPGAAMLN